MTPYERLLVFPFLALASLTGVPRDAVAQADWTVLVYLDGDNNLEPAGVNDFLEMADVGSSGDVQIVVLFDRHPGYSDAYGDWEDARRGLVNHDDVPDTSWGTSIGEVNMGNPQTLIDFVEWGMQTYPASRYAVVLWDHGTGWHADQREEVQLPPYKAVCWDSTSGDDLLVAEVHVAFRAIEIDEQQVDLVGFDACLMGMIEVAYAIRDDALVMTGSEALEPADGWPYDTILADLVADPSLTAAELGSTIVSRYYQSYNNGETHSATDLASTGVLVPRVDQFAQALRAGWNADDGECAQWASSVMAGIEDAVLAEAHGSAYPGSHGLAVYFPEASADFDPAYINGLVDFANQTRWDEFLLDFHASMAGSWIATARDQTQEYSACSGWCPHHVDLYDFCRKLIDNAAGLVWVHFGYSGAEAGTYDRPYNTLAEGVAAAAAGNTICIKPGTSSEPLTITKAVTLRACGGSVTIGQ